MQHKDCFVATAPGGNFARVEAVIESRAETHGDFPQVAAVSQTIKDAMRSDRLTDAQTEALHAIAGKIARIVCGNPDFLDHWHDIAGYAQLAANSVDGG